MYHKVCREYIPNGANLNDEQVDEVRKSLNWSRITADFNYSTLQPGVLCTVLVCQSMLRALCVSLLVRMVSGLTEKSWVSMEQLACREGVIYHNYA